MEREIGALLCALSGLTAGISNYGSRRKRLDALMSLVHALTCMRCELSGRRASMPLLIEYTARCAKGEAAVFFESVRSRFDSIGEISFEEIWRGSVSSGLKDLSDDERESVAELGSVLGKTGADMQLEELMKTESFLRGRAEELRRALPQLRRTALGLGTAAGMLAAIVLY